MVGTRWEPMPSNPELSPVPLARPCEGPQPRLLSLGDLDRFPAMSTGTCRLSLQSSGYFNRDLLALGQRCGPQVAIILTSLIMFSPPGANAGETLVAVATNFANVMRLLERRFETGTTHLLTVTTGSTGKLYAQIAQGAPFDILLAADDKRPQQLEEQGYAVAGSRFTYAIGRLVLWSSDPGLIRQEGAATLRSGRYRSLAIANPALAPYGEAARQTLSALGLDHATVVRLVMGQNVGQTFSMVVTGNAELGFVALAQVLDRKEAGSQWLVPNELHQPIRQDAVRLARASHNRAAQAFMAFLRSAQARQIIARHGYIFD